MPPATYYSSILSRFQVGCPKFSHEKVDISIENNVLCLKGESEKKSEVDDKNYYRKEIRRGSFYRSIALPAKVDSDKAVATNEGGMLKIVIPKAAELKAKKIEIQKK